MNFQEAVDKMRSLNIPHSAVRYEYCFHEYSGERAECALYTARFGGIWVQARTWEAAFAQMEDKIAQYENIPPAMDQAPQGEPKEAS
jgi:hypothetical protein